MQREIWLALSYTVPINPSKARVYVWRKLKEFGAEYFKQGVAILPNNALSMQRFTALGQKIRQMGGEASIVELRFTDPADQAQMAERFAKQMEQEYHALLSDCRNALQTLQHPGAVFSSKENEQLRQMIKRYQKARARDCFQVGAAAAEIEEGLYELIDEVRTMAGDMGKQLRSLMES